MQQTESFLDGCVPSVLDIRDRLAKALRETEILRRLLRVAERVEKERAREHSDRGGQSR